MFPPILEVESDRGMVGESGESTFSGVVNAFLFGASCPELAEFIGRE
jgi:hypothetical protein